MTSTSVLRLLLIVLIIFHLGILVQWISYEWIWGGKFKNFQEVFPMLIISLLVLGFQYFSITYSSLFSPKTYRILILVFLFYGILNTVLNLLSTSTIEKIFAIFSSAMAYLYYLQLK